MHRSAAQLEELNAVNVSERFKILLRTGFYISLVYTLLWILFYTPCIQDNKIIKKIGFWTLFGASLVYLGHFTTANVFRFEHSGRVCSGDFGWDPKHPHDLPPIPPKPQEIEIQTLDKDFGHAFVEPTRYLVQVEGDFIKTYIIVQYSFLGYIGLVYLIFRLRKKIKSTNKQPAQEGEDDHGQSRYQMQKSHLLTNSVSSDQLRWYYTSTHSFQNQH